MEVLPYISVSNGYHKERLLLYQGQVGIEIPPPNAVVNEENTALEKN